MSIFSVKEQSFFDQANWEVNPEDPLGRAGDEVDFHNHLEHSPTGKQEPERNPDQFILLQLDDDAQKRVLRTSEVNPLLSGQGNKPDVTMAIDIEGFKVADSDEIHPDTKATLQLSVGQEKNMTGLDKLFYCVNGGLDLFNEWKRKKADSNDFKKSTSEALGNRPISLPMGMGQISLKVVRHREPLWWQKIFSFAKTDKGRELVSLVGFPGINQTAVHVLGNMMDNLFTRQPEILFQSLPIRVALSQAAKEEMAGGLSSAYVSCLNPGYWIMARQSDYEAIMSAKPVYYNGYGILAPDGMSETDALRDAGNNPFSKLTYAVIRARIKEVDLGQNII